MGAPGGGWHAGRDASSFGGSDCEAVRDAVLAQPVNSLSSLAYVAAGAWVLRRGPVAPAVALAAVGAGSVLYHGPMTAGAELAHDGSIVAFVAATCLVAWRRRSRPRPPALALAALAAGWPSTWRPARGHRCAGPTAWCRAMPRHVLTAFGLGLALSRAWAPHPAGPHARSRPSAARDAVPEPGAGLPQ